MDEEKTNAYDFSKDENLNDNPANETFEAAKEQPKAENPVQDNQVPAAYGNTAYGKTSENGAPDGNSAYSYTPNTDYRRASMYTPYGSAPDMFGAEPPKVPKPKRQHTFGLGMVILCIILSVVVSAAASLAIAFSVKGDSNAASSENSSSDSVSEPGTNYPSTNISIENVESLVEAVYDKSAKSVVGIRTTASVQNFFYGTQESTGEGSGVIYSSDGYIITNYHVIEAVVTYASSSIEVFLTTAPDEPIEAKVIGYNVSADLAVIKVDKVGLPAVEVGNSDSIKIGQYAVAIGCPGGIEFLGSVSYGIISGLNRSITIDSIGEMKLIQTDAAINPGNSGGALLNANGQLIGISSSKLVSTSFEGMGFAIPVNNVISVVKQIIENKDNPSPYIGIEVYTYDSAYLEKYNLPHGAAVKKVVDNAPASAAGIKAGDIITEFNGKAINEYTEFIDELKKCTPGAKVTVKIYRNGRYGTTSVKIGSNNSQ